ncbi:MAG: PD-(D/E)XK nuclease family protein [Candidatus Dependentiae bacterium]|nr:PD-(D/E)XK nuclease family protein [Candidatus Dependentiae bacterium]
MQKKFANKRISWSMVNLFFECPRCFYKMMVLGKKRPSLEQDLFTINNTVDSLLKSDFDTYRNRQIPHPLMAAYNIEAVPLANGILLQWRDFNQGGISVYHESSGFNLCGVLDDVWINDDGELIIVDYKVTSKDISLGQRNVIPTHGRQLDMYAYILRAKGLPVHATGYCIYNTASKRQASFDQRVEFDSIIKPHAINGAWIEPAILDMYQCIAQKSMPLANRRCHYCAFV